MTRYIDISGQKFGRLKVIKYLCTKNNDTFWGCECECGNKKITGKRRLKHNKFPSCGCFVSEIRKKAKTIHGHSVSSKTYITWEGMIQRCTNKNTINYKIYGGRGISVCQEWKLYKNFLNDMGEKPKGMSLDRIDNDKGYCKENCKWATRKEQSRNRGNNVLITFNNETKCISEWAEITSINVSTLWCRIVRNKWPIEKALTTLTIKGESYAPC